MTTKKFIGTLVIGTLIFFIWNAISWMALPFHSNSFSTIPEQAIDFDKLKAALPADGVYHFPGYPDTDDAENVKAVEQRMANGPRVALMVYKEGGSSLFDPQQFIWGLLINLATVLLLYYVVSGFAIRTSKTMMAACLFIGLIISFVSDLSLMNWYFYPLDFTIANIIDHIVPFLLIGLLFGSYTFKNMKTV